MNVFIFNKSLRLQDNTTLIKQTILEGSILPIFIFTEQINPKKNKYFNNRCVQFMIESLKDLSDNILEYGGKLYMFHCENVIELLDVLNNKCPINSIGYNFYYSPYEKLRQKNIKEFCNVNKIKVYSEEDDNIHENFLLAFSNSKTPYKVFTPFKNYCTKLKILKPNKFNKFKFVKLNKQIYYEISSPSKFYSHDNGVEIIGGRIHGLKILNNASNFNDYEHKRNYLVYKTTRLSAYLNFGCISIREVYAKFSNNKSILNELQWREFYYYIIYHFPDMLRGQVTKLPNKGFKKEFDKIKWEDNNELFHKWCDGNLGIPICDAGMRQLNTTGFMHNRVRMITANILTRLLMIDWRKGEEYFAKKLIDYSPIQNNGNWAWSATGIDPKQAYRIFNPRLQLIKFDNNCEYVKKYIQELQNVPNKDIHNWNDVYKNYKDINYPKPAIDYITARKKALSKLKK
jgi:deoxyribodipyrimidine photo-lyase